VAVTQTPISQMTLPDLYATKFRILQRLENNRLLYNLVKVKKMRVFGDDDGRKELTQTTRVEILSVLYTPELMVGKEWPAMREIDCSLRRMQVLKLFLLRSLFREDELHGITV
jgi:hypothetical protein